MCVFAVLQSFPLFQPKRRCKLPHIVVRMWPRGASVSSPTAFNNVLYNIFHVVTLCARLLFNILMKSDPKPFYSPLPPHFIPQPGLKIPRCSVSTQNGIFFNTTWRLQGSLWLLWKIICTKMSWVKHLLKGTLGN